MQATSTLANVVSEFSQSAAAAIITEAAVQAAREAAKSGQSDAWSVARIVATDCEIQEWSNDSKADIFALAMRKARTAFAESCGSEWTALGSASSTLKGALLLGVEFADSGKSAVAKSVALAKSAHEKGMMLRAVDAGILPAQSTPESLNLALTREMVQIKSDLDLTSQALQAAQERLIPLDSLKSLHESDIAAIRAELADALRANEALRAELEKAVKPRKAGKIS